MDEENVPVPPGSLLIDEETNCFVLEVEDQDELIKVSNFSWTLHKPVKNFVSDAKYVGLKVKFEKVNSMFIWFHKIVFYDVLSVHLGSCQKHCRGV